MISARKRSRLLSAVCIMGFIWSFANLIYVFSPFLKHASIWLPALYGLTIALRFISFVGVWHMKKWGVHLFLFNFVFGISILVLFNVEISPLSVILGLLAMTVFLLYYRKMDENL
ncbi:MAG: hypothetical protein AB1458_06385 [Bacteroidota bacterium]